MISYFAKRSKYLAIILSFIKKIKGKIQWDFDPKVSLENYLSEVVHIFWRKGFLSKFQSS